MGEEGVVIGFAGAWGVCIRYCIGDVQSKIVYGRE